MQISTSYLFDRATTQMNKLTSDLAKSQTQIASAKQVLNPSDAPDKAAAISRLKSVIGRQDNYVKTLDSVQNRLNLENTTLNSVSDALLRVKEITIQVNAPTLSQSDRQALGGELRALRDQLLSLANTKDVGGNYTFAGSRVRQPAFANDGSYLGDQTRMQVAVGDQRDVAINRSGSMVFTPVVRTDANGLRTGVGFFQVLDDLIVAVKSSDSTGKPNATADMQRGIAEADSMLQGVLLAQGEVGTDMKVVEQQGNVLMDITLSLKTVLSNIEDLDYAAAATQMQKQMLALQAAQATFAKISQNSLFNYIK